MAGKLCVLILDPSSTGFAQLAGVVQQADKTARIERCRSLAEMETFLAERAVDLLIVDRRLWERPVQRVVEAYRTSRFMWSVVVVDSERSEPGSADAVIARPGLSNLDALMQSSREIRTLFADFQIRKHAFEQSGGRRGKQPAAAQPESSVVGPYSPGVLPRSVATKPGGGQKPLRVVGLGASTGGTGVLCDIFAALPRERTAYAVVQHIFGSFTEKFVARLVDSSRLEVVQAKDGDEVVSGCVYVAPADRHLRVIAAGDGLYCAVGDDAPVSNHRPSVDALFESLAGLPIPVLGVLLTGMGVDGAAGMLALQAAQHRTIAQDEASSAVWGMPGAAVKAGAADDVLDCALIAPAIQAWCKHLPQPTRGLG